MLNSMMLCVMIQMNFYGMIIYQIKKKDTIILLNSLGDLLIYACMLVVTVSGFKMIYEGQCFFLVFEKY
jgi:hypothetical protein